MIYTNTRGYPQYVYNALVASRNEYTKSGDYSASQLAKPPQMVALERKYRHEIIVDVADLMQQFVGTAVHNEFARFDDKSALIEEEFLARVEVDGEIFKISGRPDRYTPNIEDIKTTSVWSFMFANGKAKPEWESQLNVCAALARIMKFDVGELWIHAFLLDWKKNEARVNPKYPQSRFHKVRVPDWGQEKTLLYIQDRVRQFEANHRALTMGNPLILCTAEDRWERDHKYAAIKRGNKKATKLFDTQSEAQAFVKAHKDGAHMDIIEREGASTRCLDWCDVAPFCQQWAEIQKEGA